MLRVPFNRCTPRHIVKICHFAVILLIVFLSLSYSVVRSFLLKFEAYHIINTT